jgi:hypothetical protein
MRAWLLVLAGCVGQPLLLDDGTMIVRSGGVVARLDANAEPLWKIDTGWNRYHRAERRAETRSRRSCS